RGSQGDREPLYRECLSRCERQNCSGAALRHFRARQPLYMGLTGWTCRDECKYECMWLTVRLYQQGGHRVPQFHGKGHTGRCWAVLGTTGLYWGPLDFAGEGAGLCWASLGITGAPGRTLGHTGRALGHVGRTLGCTGRTLTMPLPHRTLGLQRPALISIFRAFLLLFLAGHISYLSLVRFDYGYNLVANAAAGMLTVAWWLRWCLRQGRRLPHVWKCAAAVLLLQALALLELLDFPPLLWVLDAHALWHIGTIPLNVLFYSFLMDDSLYLLKANSDL
ncbi:PGAP3 factor, partial [Sterrhoptilus dennistouni]|nr:PGAP3 factor [Sterrhoptilus dennistouni]